MPTILVSEIGAVVVNFSLTFVLREGKRVGRKPGRGVSSWRESIFKIGKRKFRRSHYHIFVRNAGNQCQRCVTFRDKYENSSSLCAGEEMANNTGCSPYFRAYTPIFSAFCRNNITNCVSSWHRAPNLGFERFSCIFGGNTTPRDQDSEGRHNWILNEFLRCESRTFKIRIRV